MKSMSISVILDWIPDKYRIFYKSTGLDQLFRHARMLDDSMEIIDNDFLYLTQESSFEDLLRINDDFISENNNLLDDIRKYCKDTSFF